MPAKSPTERLNELDKTFATVAERLDNTIKELAVVYNGHRDLAQLVSEWRLAYERESISLKRDLEELRKSKEDQKKGREEWVRRLWALTPNLTAAIIGALVAYFVSRKP
jgi:hypothetical protein